MKKKADHPLGIDQLVALRSALHRGSTDAAEVLARWIGKQSVIEMDKLQQLPLEEATEVLSAKDDPICFCSVEICGVLTGEMILAFDDVSGFALADMLLDRPHGSTDAWGEMETSAALETTNILCCAYLSSLSDSLSSSADSAPLIPSPPRFSRDFAESLLECAVMGQAVSRDRVLVAQARFEIEAMPVDWILLFIPDDEAIARLPLLLRKNGDAASES